MLLILEYSQYYLKVDSIFKNQNRNEPTLAAVQSNIGNIFMHLKNYHKAQSYFANSADSYKRLGHLEGENSVKVKLGQLQWSRGNHEVAIKDLTSALEYYKSINNANEISSITGWIGAGYLELKKIPEATAYFEESLKYAIMAGDKFLEANGLVNLAEIARLKKKPDESIPYLTKALEIYGEMKISYNKPQILKLLSQSFEQKQHFELALDYARQYQNLTDSLTKEENVKSLLELETKYQTEKKEQEIALLKAENNLKEKQQYIYIGIAILLLASGLFLFFGYRNKIKTAEKLKELNELKSRFFANISHEFRTPLTLIKSPLQQLQSASTTDIQNKQLGLIDANANRMLELVDQLLELSKIDSGKLQIILKKGNLKHFLESVIDPFQFKAKNENIHFNYKLDKLDDETYFDKDIITKIVSNLLDNAFKYNDNLKPITFSAQQNNNNLVIDISNYNNQLKASEHKKLFERFYQKDTTVSGFGIGLALVKDLVELYEGSIQTDFNNAKISFTVTMPLGKALKNAIVIDKETETTKEVVDPDPELAHKDDVPILLLVEDNPSIREVLKDIFKPNYKILEASNGKEALKIAQKEIPDAIISDIMMPEMDGLEFTKQLKNNELTSFIPIILVTAKTTDATHLEALQSTADAFLTKPFNHDVLKATVQQQIAERKKLQAHYSQELILKPTEVVINSVYEKFINSLQALIQQEFTHPEFNTSLFADKMNMSRMQLHRKLKSLFGVSATEFVRNERLKTAAEMMKNKKLAISEIAYNVGFNDVFYFSKCFKELYKVVPSEYQKSL